MERESLFEATRDDNVMMEGWKRRYLQLGPAA